MDLPYCRTNQAPTCWSEHDRQSQDFSSECLRRRCGAGQHSWRASSQVRTRIDPGHRACRDPDAGKPLVRPLFRRVAWRAWVWRSSAGDIADRQAGLGPTPRGSRWRADRLAIPALHTATHACPRNPLLGDLQPILLSTASARATAIATLLKGRLVEKIEVRDVGRMWIEKGGTRLGLVVTDRAAAIIHGA